MHAPCFVSVFLDIIDDSDEFKVDSARKLSLIGHICMYLAHSNAVHVHGTSILNTFVGRLENKKNSIQSKYEYNDDRPLASKCVNVSIVICYQPYTQTGCSYAMSFLGIVPILLAPSFPFAIVFGFGLLPSIRCGHIFLFAYRRKPSNSLSQFSVFLREPRVLANRGKKMTFLIF